ncbi:MAG: peptide chain release factor 1 [Candidatus Paceibacterota bacterium]
MVDIESIKKEYEDILNQLSDPELISDFEKFENLSKRKNFLEKVIEKGKELETIKNRIEENKVIISANESPDLASLAETEIVQFQEREKSLEKEVENLLNNNGTSSGPQAVIVEIRAGTGGQEAALFAGDLFKMYNKYAQIKGWRQKVLDSRPSDLSGLKEIIFELKGNDVFSKMKYEGGVHRVQRIPATEKNGRIHTSTASVAVLPKPKKTEIKIRPEDLKIDTYHSSGPGGQYVNKRMTAVRITYLPTGLVVTSQSERNMLQNKENALSILEARILEKKLKEEETKMSGKRKTQIGGAKRAEKIRTYNFPQDRITDHRVKKSWHNLEKILDGNLEEIVSDIQNSNFD